MSVPLFEMPAGAKKLLTADEVAALFKVTRRTVARWANRGRFPGAVRTPGGHWRFPIGIIGEAS